MVERSKMLTSAEKKWLELKIIMGNKTQRGKKSHFFCCMQNPEYQKSYESRRELFGNGKKDTQLV